MLRIVAFNEKTFTNFDIENENEQPQEAHYTDRCLTPVESGAWNLWNWVELPTAADYERMASRHAALAVERQEKEAQRRARRYQEAMNRINRNIPWGRVGF
jgi:DNA replication protein DnaC